MAKTSLRWYFKAAKSAYKRANARIGLALETTASDRYKTADWGNIQQFGKGFLDNFPETRLRGKKRSTFVVSTAPSDYESSACVALRNEPLRHGQLRTPTYARDERIIARVKLGFTEGIVIIEALSGRKGAQPDLEQFREIHGKPALNYLVGQVEAHARKSGFSEVRIRAPETLWHYWHPFDLTGGKSADMQWSKKVRAQMEALYNGVANSMGYKRKGRFFVKKL